MAGLGGVGFWSSARAVLEGGTCDAMVGVFKGVSGSTGRSGRTVRAGRKLEANRNCYCLYCTMANSSKDRTTKRVMIVDHPGISDGSVNTPSRSSAFECTIEDEVCLRTSCNSSKTDTARDL